MYQDYRPWCVLGMAYSSLGGLWTWRRGKRTSWRCVLRINANTFWLGSIDWTIVGPQAKVESLTNGFAGFSLAIVPVHSASIS